MNYKIINEFKYNPFCPEDIKTVIFKNRGIDNFLEYINPTKEHLYSPFLLTNMKAGIDLLLYHINSEHNIFIIVDSDVDGYTSAGILYNYITEVMQYFNISWMVHADKSHGINLDLIPLDTHLVICPDSSSNEYDKHEILHEKGIDILVIDHHEAPHFSAHAIVINNKLSEEYPNPYLSGAGVVLKFCQGIDQILYKDTPMDKTSENFLDLAALGIVSDMMDIRDMENRYIITEGLKNIQNPFFLSLIKKQSFSIGQQNINSIGIMFYIAPLINAITRVGTIEEREIMFEAIIDGKQQVNSTKRGAAEGASETVAEQATRIAYNARNRQKKIVDEVLETIHEDLIIEDMVQNPVIIVTLEKIPNRNLSGLVANQLANRYKKPVLLLISKEDSEDYTGSGRNYALSDLKNFKDCLNDMEIFNFAEGHQSAFGVSINKDNIDEINNIIQTKFPDLTDAEDAYLVDFIFKADDFDENAIKEIVKFRSLWGKGFDEPLIAIEKVFVNSQTLSIMGKAQNHLKFENKGIVYVKFNVTQEEIDKLKDKNLTISVVGRCDVNIWGDKMTYQVLIQDYKIVKEESEFVF